MCKFIAAMMAISMLLVSTIPTATAVICDLTGNMSGTASSMGAINLQAEPAAALIDWQDCYIECGCRINNQLDGMPHQLAPHAWSLDSFDVAPAVKHVIIIAEPVFTSRRLPFPTPPPRSI